MSTWEESFPFPALVSPLFSPFVGNDNVCHCTSMVYHAPVMLQFQFRLHENCSVIHYWLSSRSDASRNDLDELEQLVSDLKDSHTSSGKMTFPVARAPFVAIVKVKWRWLQHCRDNLVNVNPDYVALLGC